MLAHHRLEGFWVGHRDHLSDISHLHGWGVGVAIHCDHPAAEALGCDGHLLTQLTAAEQHQGGGKSGRGGKGHGGRPDRGQDSKMEPIFLHTGAR